MVPSSVYGSVTGLSALVVWVFMSSCNTDDGGAFTGTGGSTSVGGANGGGSGGSGNGTNAATGTGGVVAGTVNPDAGTFEPVTTINDPATPYVTTCGSCPATEPLRVQCSSGCCCAHYCAGQFGSLTDKPCCDEQGGVIGLNCTTQ